MSRARLPAFGLLDFLARLGKGLSRAGRMLVHVMNRVHLRLRLAWHVEAASYGVLMARHAIWLDLLEFRRSGRDWRGLEGILLVVVERDELGEVLDLLFLRSTLDGGEELRVIESWIRMRH